MFIQKNQKTHVEFIREKYFQEADCAKYGGIKKDGTPAPLGSDPCTWGPSYWCASIANAQKCGLTVS